MKVQPNFPTYASGNCDFTDKMRGQLALGPDDAVVVFDVDVDDLPSGVLCIHTDTVLEMLKLLGWELVDDTWSAKLGEALIEAAELRLQLERFTNLQEILDAMYPTQRKSKAQS